LPPLSLMANAAKAKTNGYDESSILKIKRGFLWNDDADIRSFLEYWKKEWVDQNSKWFEGYNHPFNAGAPSTNNGNEGCNGSIKLEDTLRNLLPLFTFLAVAKKLVR
jgi:hypothetical protein